MIHEAPHLREILDLPFIRPILSTDSFLPQTYVECAVCCSPISMVITLFLWRNLNLQFISGIYVDETKKVIRKKRLFFLEKGHVLLEADRCDLVPYSFRILSMHQVSEIAESKIHHDTRGTVFIVSLLLPALESLHGIVSRSR